MVIVGADRVAKYFTKIKKGIGQAKKIKEKFLFWLSISGLRAF